ncbi:MAG: efflux RND transporter permease subunit [Alphaproteobacteria bacterium]|nr:efflux RND transporter permease subunit [Alphaproteobacteria bacterium]
MISFFIRHPVFSTVLNCLIFLAGILCWQLLPISEYPYIEKSELSVHTHYPNASAELVEVSITNPLEDLLADVKGLKSMTSSSMTGQSIITLKFKEGVSVDHAMTLARDALMLSRDRLPEGVKEPTIRRSGNSEDWPFIGISLFSSTMNAAELSHFANMNLKNPFRSLSGVAIVELWGQPYTMSVTLDSNKMKTFGLSCHDVMVAFEKAHIPLPAGKFQEQIPITFDLAPKTPEDFETIVIRNHQDQDILLKHIANVKLDVQKDNFRQHIEGKPGTLIAIRKTTDANPLEVAQKVKEEFGRLNEQFGDVVTMSLVIDQSKVIDRSLSNIRTTFIEAIVLVFLIIVIFLGNWRSAFIPLVTIPLSLVGSFLFYVWVGISLNILTFLAMILAIGLVVDDAIVVLENIHRYIEKGLSPLEAALKGSREIVFAIIAMTLTLASVYAPIAFTGGSVGALFWEFAVALAGAVSVSGFVALTLSPMMCSQLLKKIDSAAHETLADRLLNKLSKNYQNALQQFIAIKPRYLGLGMLIGGVFLIILYRILPYEISPVEDRGMIGAYVSPLPGQGIDTLESYLTMIEKKLITLPEKNMMLTFMGGWGGNVLVVLKDWEERSRHTADIQRDLKDQFNSFPSFDVECWTWQCGLPGLDILGNNSEIELVVQSNMDYPKFFEMLEEFRKFVDKKKIFLNVRHNLKLNMPAFRVKTLWKNLNDVGLSPKLLSETLEIFQGGIQKFEFLKDGLTYPVTLKGSPKPWSLDELYITSSKGESISLGSLLKMEPSVLPARLNHDNQMRSASIIVGLKPKQDLKQGMGELLKLKHELLPSSIKTEWSETIQFYLDSHNTLLKLTFLALLFIYAILAMQFESWLDPVLIMTTVPLAAIGGMVFLLIFNQSLNIYTQIGLITLIGLITKHGILLVEFANKAKLKGESVEKAILSACMLRLRPILMTTAAMVLGAVPLAFASGAGAEARRAIGLVLVGGLGVGTSLTLFILPYVYCWAKKVRFS